MVLTFVSVCAVTTSNLLVVLFHVIFVPVEVLKLF
jgi:hypothetical protein